jgi:GT2 family glycosyltransferase
MQLGKKDRLNTAIISIVIINKNQGQITLDCLNSIKDQKYNTKNIQIIIVDIDSTDGSTELIQKNFIDKEKERFLDIKLIRIEKDKGFPNAFNIGLNNCVKEYLYVLKLDNDIKLDSRCLSELVKLGNRSEKTGIIGGKLYYYMKGPTRDIQSIGFNFGYFLDYLGNIGYGNDTGKFEKILKIDAPHGAMMLIKRPVLQRLGGLDEDFFIFCDDYDFCYRAKKEGFDALYNPKALGWHRVSMERKAPSRFRIYNTVKSPLLFARKHYSFVHFVLYFAFNIFAVQLGSIVNSFKSIRPGNIGAILKADFEVLEFKSNYTKGKVKK